MTMEPDFARLPYFWRGRDVPLLQGYLARAHLGLLALFVCTIALAAIPAQPSAFSAAAPDTALPAGWSIQPLPKVERRTRFDLVADNGTTVLRARADNAAASLRYPLDIAPDAITQLDWRWKTARVLDKADLTSKAGDDYAARLYVFFDRKPAQMSFGERIQFRLGRARYGEQLPAAALCYVWDNKQPVDTVRDNAYTGFVKMIVATSGKAQAGHWVALQRDLRVDYLRAFGTAPPRITGIAVAADTDNTGESTVSYFGDIRFETGRAAQ